MRVGPFSAEKARVADRALPAVALAALILITVVAYEPFLSTGFAATDSLSLVESSRIANLGDAALQFTRPVMAGTRFTSGEVVYRPFVSLTFGIEYALWGLNGVGYHLTNLLLHLVAVISTWIVLTGLGLRWWSSLAGAAVVALHPVVVASVPVIARRDSVAPVAAFTCSVALLLAFQRTGGLRRALGIGGSVLLMAIALTSKESAFLALSMLPVLLVAAGLGDGASLSCMMRRIAPVLLFFALAGLVFVVRLQVLGGLGGGAETSGLQLVDLDRYGQIIGAYTRELLWPFASLAPSTREVWQRLAAVLVTGSVAVTVGLPLRQRFLALAGIIWVVSFGAFCAILKVTTIAWLAYFALFGVGLVCSACLEGALLRLKPSTRHSWATRAQRASAYIAVVALTIFGSSSAAASALVHTYDQWQIAGDVTRRYTDALEACVASAPRAAQVTLREVPGSLDDGRVETNLMGVTLLADWTIDAALRLAFPDRLFDVGIASWGTLRATADTLRFSCVAASDGNRVELSAAY